MNDEFDRPNPVYPHTSYGGEEVLYEVGELTHAT